MVIAPAAPIAPSAPGLGASAAGTSAASGSSAGSGGFAGLLSQALSGLASLQTQADTAAQQLATGQSGDIATAVVAAEKANLAMSLAVQVRNQALSAYQQIMQMQV